MSASKLYYLFLLLVCMQPRSAYAPASCPTESPKKSNSSPLTTPHTTLIPISGYTYTSWKEPNKTTLACFALGVCALMYVYCKAENKDQKLDTSDTNNHDS